MNRNTKLIDFLCPKQKWIEGCAIFLLCLAISFKYENGKTTWLWNDYPVIVIAIVLTLLLTAATWIRIERIQVSRRIKKISTNQTNNNSKPEQFISQLTSRQREVFRLISEGKSNKEIMAELFIEHSTLKTHINMIYKTLNIKTRKEAKALGKPN